LSLRDSWLRNFPALSRHWRVLREAWRLENEASRSRRPIVEHEFLPAALEIMENPPSPGLRVLTLSLCLLFAIAVTWSILGRVDVVAVASGRTIPASSIKLIQSIEIGAVRAIYVHDGQPVRKGELLIELDPTVAGAEEAQAGRGLLSSQINQATNGAFLAYLEGRAADFRAPAGTPPNVVETQRQLIRAKIAEYEAGKAALAEGRAERAAELASAQAEIAKLRETLPLLDQQLAARRLLAEQGNFSRLRLLEYEQARVEHVHNIDVQLAAAARARAGMANVDAQMRALREEFAGHAATDLATAEGESSQRGEELRKSERRRVMQQLRAPVDGTVQQLAVHTVGGIVQPAQPLMVIVPSAAPIEVEANILNRDIGFVREGQRVRVKLEAFPFTDYGLIEGTIETISRDAVENEKLGLIYNARIRLNRNYLVIGGRRRPIGPGLAVQAEIKTGRRRIIQYILSPVSTTVAEAGRER
jgi:hemolysin D